MKYRMQVYVSWTTEVPTAKQWRFVQRGDGKIYEYDTHKEAYRMLNMSYPDLSWGTQKRVTDKDGNEVIHVGSTDGFIQNMHHL